MITLGIETSCDETAIALYDSDKGLIGEAVFSQIELHGEYGGVIPELASRDHCQKITHIFHKALGDTQPEQHRSDCLYCRSRIVGDLINR